MDSLQGVEALVADFQEPKARKAAAIATATSDMRSVFFLMVLVCERLTILILKMLQQTYTGFKPLARPN